MAEVRYSLNGKYFKDFGVYITESDGLFDQLKRKTVNSYDWAEYHGSSVDLSTPKFEAREITLKGYVMGADWLTMKTNFDAIVGEFQKPGTQRLLIEPLGLKPMPFEVYADGGVTLEKRFRQGRTVGTFTLKMIEPNPIKKVLYFTGTTLNLAYNSPTETEIFYGNELREVGTGNVSLSGKTLADRNLSKYAFQGRNFYQQKMPVTEVTTAQPAYKDLSNPDVARGFAMLAGTEFRINNVIKSNGYWSISFEAFSSAPVDVMLNPNDIESPENIVKITPTKIFFSRTILVSNYSDALYHFVDFKKLATSNVYISYLKIEKGTPTPYSPAPEEEKFIIIAGNVEEITNLTTNATVLWEKL